MGKLRFIPRYFISQSFYDQDILNILYLKRSKGNIGNEVLYRFEFPERPGALLDFLKKIGSDWNISLFHYRNHGCAGYGETSLYSKVFYKPVVL
jgi:hypothetical protein